MKIVFHQCSTWKAFFIKSTSTCNDWNTWPNANGNAVFNVFLHLLNHILINCYTLGNPCWQTCLPIATGKYLVVIRLNWDTTMAAMLTIACITFIWKFRRLTRQMWAMRPWVTTVSEFIFFILGNFRPLLLRCYYDSHNLQSLTQSAKLIGNRKRVVY